jgi:hypothetical protein
LRPEKYIVALLHACFKQFQNIKILGSKFERRFIWANGLPTIPSVENVTFRLKYQEKDKQSANYSRP